MVLKSRRKKSARADALFPFVGVLFSAIGALSLIWAASSLESVAEDETLPDRIRALEEEIAQLELETADTLAVYESLQAQITATELRLDQLQEQLDQAAREQQQLQIELESIRDRIAALRERLAEIELLQSELLALNEQLSQLGPQQTHAEEILRLQAELHEKQQRLDDLQAEEARQMAKLLEREALVAELQNQIDELEALDQPRPTLVVADGKVSEYQWYDVSAEGYRNIGQQSELIAPEAFFAGQGPFDRLIEQVAQERSGYPILLVRPGALGTYRRFAQALRERRVAYATEPVDATWDLRAAFEADQQP